VLRAQISTLQKAAEHAAIAQDKLGVQTADMARALSEKDEQTTKLLAAAARCSFAPYVQLRDVIRGVTEFMVRVHVGLFVDLELNCAPPCYQDS
jgi:hypothetical protein